MKAKLLRLEEGELEIELTKRYRVYGKDILGKDLLNLDFTHVPWLDQIALLNELNMADEVTILYHPEVIHSLHSKFEQSPYWGKDHYEALAIFQKESANNALESKENARRARAMLQPFDMKTSKARIKKNAVVTRLEKKGYSRDLVKKYANEYLALNGSGLFNLIEGEVVDILDEYILAACKARS
ncbi:hypothetical protein GCM10009128_06100 [Psychrosphaera haliotis]|uniref:hypothetical protein n=1 Tax=Psychrosphaera haliotis TaxID=555083 RepID=UPI0031CE4729